MRPLLLTSLVLLPCLAAADTPAPALPTTDPYYADGQATLAARRAVKPNTRRAKNVILFVGDGMDPTTVAAARIFDGQSRGESGEENFLFFERFPHLAMSKTYNTNAQTPDSAGTMTAMVTGVKTKAGVLSVTDAAEYNNCESSLGNHAITLGELAVKAAMGVGVVTTTRITHATPAAVYAHSPNRGWESDADLTAEAREHGCKDIARQLIESPYAHGFQIMLGGGRGDFTPAAIADPEYPQRFGRRQDGRNLTDEWTQKSASHVYIWSKEQFDAVNAAASPHVLGLFEPSHMRYEADRQQDAAGEPSLAEMTAKSIEILSRNRNGYFLMVEGGRIDHAHHGGNAARALIDTQAFAEAVRIAADMTDDRDTLIVVTADHGHSMTFQGYPRRGNPILGLVHGVAGGEGDVSEGPTLAADGKPYTTLAYTNGPGSPFFGRRGEKIERPSVSADEATHLDHRQQAIIPLSSETHGGQDVTIYASGPRAYLFGGVVEQSYVFHVINDALNLTRRARVE
jgi:alkaline phosphatase